MIYLAKCEEKERDKTRLQQQFVQQSGRRNNNNKETRQLQQFYLETETQNC